MPEEPRPATSEANVQKYSLVMGQALDLAQVAIYLIAALLLILLAFLAFFIIARDMGSMVQGSMTIESVDKVLGDILIVFVITGLIQTLINYIKTHSIDPWLVLSVGLTAIVRRIIVFGAKAPPYEDVAVTAALLLVIVLGLYLIDRRCRSPDRQR